MEKRSILAKLLVLVLIAALAPMVLSANTPYCAPPNCQGDCPEGTWDCTQGWLYESWENFQMAVFLWLHGYSVLACCNH
jgi:hypothetical protein